MLIRECGKDKRELIDPDDLLEQVAFELDLSGMGGISKGEVRKGVLGKKKLE